MKMKLAAVAAAVVLMAGCATRQETGMLIGATVGGVAGAAVGTGAGSVVGGVVGAGIGSVVGGAIGAKTDKQDYPRAMTAIDPQPVGAQAPMTSAEMKPEVKYASPEKNEATMAADMKVEKKTTMKKQHKWVKE